MKKRIFGKTKVEVSEVGLGCWAMGGPAFSSGRPVGWGPVEDRDSLQAIEKALELGINFFDTADMYGWGHSEEILGSALQGKREKVFIATKVGNSRTETGEGLWDSSRKYILGACDQSLKRLKTDYIDLYQLHGGRFSYKNSEPADVLETFELLRQAGKIRYFGLSTHDLDFVKQFNSTGQLHGLQLHYNALDRGIEKEILPYCRQNNIGVIIRGPLHMGLLTGKFNRDSNFASDDVRHNWPKEEWFPKKMAAVDKMRQLEGNGKTLGQLALQFVLAHPAVSVIIPGAKTAAQVERNALAGCSPLTGAELEHLQSLAAE